MMQSPEPVSWSSSLALLLSGLVLLGAGLFLWFAADAAGLDRTGDRGTMRTVREMGDWVVWLVISCGVGGIFYGGRGLLRRR